MLYLWQNINTMIRSRIIKKGIDLFRYDVKEPPVGSWSANFKSPVYVIEDDYFGLSTMRPKNEIGAYFFFDKERDAIDVGKNTLAQKESSLRIDNPSSSLWITQTTTEEDIKLLDLTFCNDIVDLYVSLYKLDIDIFRDDFYKITAMDSEPLSHIKESVAYIAEHSSNPKSIKQLECECSIINIYDNIDVEHQLPFACQQLTDFGNGVIFKNILEEKGYEGYMFHESDATTICLFQSQKLEAPVNYLI